MNQYLSVQLYIYYFICMNRLAFLHLYLFCFKLSALVKTIFIRDHSHHNKITTYLDIDMHKKIHDKNCFNMCTYPGTF